MRFFITNECKGCLRTSRVMDGFTDVGSCGTSNIINFCTVHIKRRKLNARDHKSKSISPVWLQSEHILNLMFNSS